MSHRFIQPSRSNMLLALCSLGSMPLLQDSVLSNKLLVQRFIFHGGPLSSVFMQSAPPLIVCHVSYALRSSTCVPMWSLSSNAQPQHMCPCPQPISMKYDPQPKHPQVMCPTSMAYITLSQHPRGKSPHPLE
jgi:hypothetical protein